MRVWRILLFLSCISLVSCGGLDATHSPPTAEPQLAQSPAEQGLSRIAVESELLDTGGQPPAIGDPAPVFAFVLDGREQRLSDLRSKRVLINFWATWCGPCKLEMPDLNRVAADAVDLVVLGVNLKEDEGQVRDFAQELSIAFPLILDSQGEIASRYGAANIPISYFIDREGRVAYRHLGVMTESFVHQKLAQIP